MKIKYETKLTMLVTVFVFFLLFGISTLFGDGIGRITGNVVMESPLEGQVAVQELVRAPEFNQIGDGAKICINIKISDSEVQSYRVRKNGEMFKVSQDIRYCEGQAKEDFVLTFESYGALLNAVDLSSLKFFKLPGINEDFKVWQSRFVRVGGLIKQSDEFNERYCSFLVENFESELDEWQIDCSASIESPSFFGGFFTKYWWILVLSLFIVAIAFVGISMFREVDDSPEEDTLEQLHSYIVQSRDSGLGDYQIKDTLLKSGWDTKTVKLAFEKVRKHHLSSIVDRFEKVLEMPFVSKDEDSEDDEEFDF